TDRSAIRFGIPDALRQGDGLLPRSTSRISPHQPGEYLRDELWFLEWGGCGSLEPGGQTGRLPAEHWGRGREPLSSGRRRPDDADRFGLLRLPRLAGAVRSLE